MPFVHWRGDFCRDCGVRARTFSVYVCPTCEMNPWAEGVHGLSLDFLAEHGLAPEEAMRQFFEFLGSDALTEKGRQMLATALGNGAKSPSTGD